MSELTKIGEPFELMPGSGCWAVCKGYTTNRFGKQVEVPGEILKGYVPAKAAVRREATGVRSEANPQASSLKPQAVRRAAYKPYKPKRRTERPKPLVIQREPMSTGTAWLLVLAAVVFALGYAAMCVHDQSVAREEMIHIGNVVSGRTK